MRPLFWKSPPWSETEEPNLTDVIRNNGTETLIEGVELRMHSSKKSGYCVKRPNFRATGERKGMLYLRTEKCYTRSELCIDELLADGGLSFQRAYLDTRYRWHATWTGVRFARIRALLFWPEPRTCAGCGCTLEEQV